MKKTLSELTIKDNFLFGVVMCEEYAKNENIIIATLIWNYY